MARADKFLLLLALIVVAVAAGAFGIAFSTDETEEFEESPINLVAGEDDAGNRVSRSAGPSRRPSGASAAETDSSGRKTPETILAESGTIVGTVLDHDGEPMEGVAVTTTLYFPYGQLNYGLVNKHTATATTNGEGRFAIDVPGHGLYRVAFRHLAFAPHIESDVKAGSDLKVQLHVGGAVSGTLIAKESGKAIANARFSIRQNKGSWSESATSNSEGAFEIFGLYTGELYLTVTADNYLPIKDVPVVIKKGEITVVELSLSAGRTIKGRVTDKQGTWIPDATIRVGKHTVTGDEFGRFYLGGLEQKSHGIQVHAEGFLTHYRQVGLAGSRETADLEIELDRGGRLNISVIDDQGEAVENVEVKVFESWGRDHMWDTGNTRYRAVTDENGRASISGLQREGWSQYRIRASAKEWADTYSEEFKMKPDEKEKDFSLVMRTGGAISGTITNENGAALKGVKVTLTPSNVHEWNSQGHKSSNSILTNAKGEYTFHQLSARKYRITAMARHYATQYKNNIEVVGSATKSGVDLTLKDGGIVKGSVKTQDGNPIANALITINSRSSWGRGKTDEKGEYEITNLGEGPYTATARCEGFSSDKKKKIFPVEGKIDFELRPDGYVWGKVTDRASEKPVGRYRVELQTKQTRGNNQWRTQKSLSVNDRSGKFKIFAPDGTYRLVIKSKGHTTWTRDGVAVAVTAEPDELDVKLTPGGSIEGWVKNSLGNGIPYTSIYIRKADAPEGARFIRKSQTETDGYYFIDSLETGRYEVAFVRRGSLPLTVRSSVGVFGGEITDVSVTGKKPSVVLLSAKTADEKPVSWTRVKLTALGDSPLQMRRRGWSSDGANYELRFDMSTQVRRSRVQRLTGLPAGIYRLEAQYSRYEPFEEEFELKEGHELELDIIFKKRNKKRDPVR